MIIRRSCSKIRQGYKAIARAAHCCFTWTRFTFFIFVMLFASFSITSVQISLKIRLITIKLLLWCNLSAQFSLLAL